ncbi:MAG: hypothetical protein IPO18_08355 [bacterium]|nr:hypothetical protein [bacterium]
MYLTAGCWKIGRSGGRHVLNMSDAARDRGMIIDPPPPVTQRLGVPVVPAVNKPQPRGWTASST